jgi:FkbM family methyltransferase
VVYDPDATPCIDPYNAAEMRVAGVWRYARPIVKACLGSQVVLDRARLRVPGTLPVRLSVVAGNIRMHRLIDAAAGPGGIVVDVGANIGYNTVYAAQRVGAAGRVFAIEPAADNVAILRENIDTNRLSNVAVYAIAAGRSRATRDLFLRGEASAVNSLFPESMYAAVTGVQPVPVVPLDDIVDVQPDLVKIDVEGAELDVLGGMTRLLAAPAIALVIEWHPRLQQAAGYELDALPRFLIEQGFKLRAVSHVSTRALDARALAVLAARLHRAGHPVELVARR